jgi:hypothetical protein
MKDKKEVTEEDLKILERHIQITKIRLIDMQNQFTKTIGKIKGVITIFFIVIAIISIIGYII